MAYTKQTWNNGDIITADKLNHIEDGIANAGGLFVVHANEIDGNLTMDKTWQEIYDALASDALVICSTTTEQDVYIKIFNRACINNDIYYIADGADYEATTTFYAYSANDYPVAFPG